MVRNIFFSPLCAACFSPEIVSYRQANENSTNVDLPKFDDPAFRALVEENVKGSVFNIVNSTQMQQHWNAYIAQNGTSTNTTTSTRRSTNSTVPLKPVYVYGKSRLLCLIDSFLFGFISPSRFFLDRVRLRHQHRIRHRHRDSFRAVRSRFSGPSSECRQARSRPTRSSSSMNSHTN
jgi:hypothetical protein